MWRRALKLAGSLLARPVAAPPASALVQTEIGSVAAGFETRDAKYTKVDKSHTDAHAALRDAVRELSQGLSQPLQQAPASQLAEWDAVFRATQPQALTTDQLESLARAYYEGPAAASSGGEQGLPKDEAQAHAAWTLAAARGSIEASYSLAICAREGRGCVKDAPAAFARLSELADVHNYHLAHYAVAVMLTNGEGTAADHTRAFQHFKLAAKGGVLPALHNIANAYAAGRGCKQSDHNAMLYYRASAEAGDPAGAFTLSTWLYTGRGTAAGKKLPEEAFTHALAAAHKGHPAAMFNVGAHLMQGAGVAQDYARAAEWFDKAARVGKIAEASINLANMHVQGLGVPKDKGRAVEILREYATHSPACATRLQQLLDK